VYVQCADEMGSFLLEEINLSEARLANIFTLKD